MIIYIISAVLILVLIGLGVWYFQTKKVSPKISVVRDFSCPGMTGFTFKYPVFKDWKAKSIEKKSDSECIIWLDGPADIDFEVRPGITVELNRGGSRNDDIRSDTPKNPHGVYYSKSIDLLTFLDGNDLIYVSIPGLSTYGFPSDIFSQTVIESFRFTK